MNSVLPLNLVLLLYHHILLHARLLTRNVVDHTF